MPHPTDVHVGLRVREARIAKGMSQSDLGNALGISFQQVQKYEKGTNRIGASRLHHTAGILEMPITFFFDGLEETGPGESTGETKLSRASIRTAIRLNEIPNDAMRRGILRLIDAAAENASTP